MERFVKRHIDRIKGIISGFDRILFSGTLRSLSYKEGFDIWLSSRGVLYKDFGSFAQVLSEEIKRHAEDVAAKEGRPIRYVESSRLSKEEIAKQIMEKDQIKEGLICILKCVEPCLSYSIEGNREEKKLQLVSRQRKCLHLYYYYMDREFGFMHVRIQSWLPFTLQVYVNGREWLAREMDKRKIGYQKKDNCFTSIDNIAKAQTAMDKLNDREWEGFLNLLARRVNPLIKVKRLSLRQYYWSMRQVEYATDIMFEDQESLAQIYPFLVNHAINQFSSQDVLRFLGRGTNIRFAGEVKSSLEKRVEGVRVKHWAEGNSIKMYDKQGSVLRIETTINNPRQLKVLRRVKRKGKTVMAWVRMRKGVVDSKRRVEIAMAANKRYLEALAVVGETLSSVRLLDSVSKPVEKEGRRYRALRPISQEDAKLFEVILRGEFSIQGFRNKDLRQFIACKQKVIPASQLSARTTRLLRLLRAHKLIFKVHKTNYYRITKKGQEVMSTAVKFRQSDIALLAA
jgi:hypothetical protein